MKKILKSLLLSILIMIVLSSTAFAVLDLKFVDDNSRIVNNDIESLITCANKDLYEKTGVTVSVVTKRTLDGTDSQVFGKTYEAEVTKATLNTNKNIIIIVSTKDKFCDIYVSEDLRTFIDENDINKILSSSMAPYFKKGNWNLGIEKGFKEIVKLLENHYNIDVIVDTEEIEAMSKELSGGVSKEIQVATYFVLFVIFFGGLVYTFIHGSSTKAYGVKRVGNPYRGYKFQKNSYFGYSFTFNEPSAIQDSLKEGKRAKKKSSKVAKREKTGISRIVPKKSKGKRVKTRDEDEQLTKDFFDIYKY